MKNLMIFLCLFLLIAGIVNKPMESFAKTEVTVL